MFKSLLDQEGAPKDQSQKRALQSLNNLGVQFESGFHASEYSSLDIQVDKIQNIVYCGMGASNLAAKITQSVSPLLVSVPFEIVSNYRLPIYTNSNTLVILSSYSGNTEEILSLAIDAEKRGSQIVIITTGGKLHDFAIQKHHNLIHLDSALNPSKAPRYGLFLSLGATYGLFKRLFPHVARDIDSQKIHLSIEKALDAVRSEKPTAKNPAKDLAEKYAGKGVVFVAANHLTGVGNTIKNYLNESAKTFSLNLEIPDINHHFLDGLTFPSSLKDNLFFILLNSNLYPSVITKRLKLTQEILVKQNYQVTVIKPESTDLISEQFESLVFFLLFSYYLSVVDKVDPIKTPFVDYFKNHL